MPPWRGLLGGASELPVPPGKLLVLSFLLQLEKLRLGGEGDL